MQRKICTSYRHSALHPCYLRLAWRIVSALIAPPSHRANLDSLRSLHGVCCSAAAAAVTSECAGETVSALAHLMSENQLLDPYAQQPHAPAVAVARMRAVGLDRRRARRCQCVAL